MVLRINDVAPDFAAQTTQGQISFHDWLGDSWGGGCSCIPRIYTVLHDRTRRAGWAAG